MAALLDRARQLLAAGPWDARPAEIAAVHAALYPDRAAVCQTCRGELGPAYFAIKRWAESQPDFSTSTSSNVQKTTTARFKSDSTIYTPHGLGVAYSNTNLTDKAARDILKNDPDAAGLFEVLPGAADDEEPQNLTPAQASAEQAADQAQAPAQTLPGNFDYDLLADKVFARLKAHVEQENAGQQPEAAATGLTASTGSPAISEATAPAADATADASGADDQDDEKPVRLSRMNKDQLVATYTTEVGSVPAADLTNDDLREAITKAREANA